MLIIKILITEEEEEEKEKKQEVLTHLFKFNCNICEKRTVSYADWNSFNKDLLAVTYGELELNVQGDGLALFWTLKNPNFPERIIRAPSRKQKKKIFFFFFFGSTKTSCFFFSFV